MFKHSRKTLGAQTEDIANTLRQIEIFGSLLVKNKVFSRTMPPNMSYVHTPAINILFPCCYKYSRIACWILFVMNYLSPSFYIRWPVLKLGRKHSICISSHGLISRQHFSSVLSPLLSFTVKPLVCYIVLK